MATAEEPREWIANFHDVYLNANLMRTRMMKEPIEADPEHPAAITIQPRFRLERMWHCFLYVTIEAWRSANYDQRQMVRDVSGPELELVDKLLCLGDDSGHLAHLRSTRDYMCHRDKREYWDSGRIAVATPGMFQWALTLDRAFSSMMLTAVRALQHQENRPAQ